MPRKHNISCEDCGKTSYRRPHQIGPITLCNPCQGIRNRKPKRCIECNVEFWSATRRLTCSEKCFTARCKKRDTRRKPFPKHRDTIKRWLIQEQGHACEWCKNSEWNGMRINLTLDHIDGNKKNNSRDNLRLLCWNCHSQTPTFGNKNKPNKNRGFA